MAKSTKSESSKDTKVTKTAASKAAEAAPVAKAKATSAAKGAAKAAPAGKAGKPSTAKDKAPSAKSVAAEPKKLATKAKAAPAKSPKSVITAEQFRAVEQDNRELPLEYGDTKVVLLTRDPEWIFAYWELSAETRRRQGLIRGAHNKSLALRVYTINATAHVPPFDVPVNDYTSSWYIRVPRQGSRFRVDLVAYEGKGAVTTLASSNELDLPRMEIAESNDLEFAEINDEIYHQIVQLSGGVRLKERLGSDEFLRSLQQRVFDSLSAGPLSSAGLSSGAFFGLSSGALSSAGLSSGQFGLSSGLLSSHALSSAGLFSAGIGGEGAIQTAGKERRSDFWLEVGVDVIVYGATEPDAKVTFMGQEIRLTPDGTFRVRMVLPDTTIEFPIQAVSADGDHKRAVMPVVKRHTDGDPRKPL